IKECVFDNVTFINCRLDGALFSGCTIKGSSVDPAISSGETAEELRQDRNYILPAVSPSFRRSMRQYLRGTGIEKVVSQRAGKPVALADEAPHLEEFRTATPGVALHGSRFSALTIQDPRFVAGGRLAMVRGVGS